jgi:hypothetical protein
MYSLLFFFFISRNVLIKVDCNKVGLGKVRLPYVRLVEVYKGMLEQVFRYSLNKFLHYSFYLHSFNGFVYIFDVRITGLMIIQSANVYQ